MSHRTFKSFLVLCCGIFAIAVFYQTHTLAAPAAFPAPSAAAQGGTLPEGEGKAVTEMTCSACHSVAYLTDTTRMVSQWDEIFMMMESYGATATKEQWDEIHKYVYAQLALIDINKYEAKDLQSTIGVDEKVAGAIISYRMANGGFKTTDDVKKVEGIDAAKVDALKARFVF
jgi:competence protein ComEA